MVSEGQMFYVYSTEWLPMFVNLDQCSIMNISIINAHFIYNQCVKQMTLGNNFKRSEC